MFRAIFWFIGLRTRACLESENFCGKSLKTDAATRVAEERLNGNVMESVQILTPFGLFWH